MNYPEKLQRCLEYVEALEEERRKIQVFQRELPLCLELVTQAIEACRRELLSGTTTVEYLHGQSECSEQTSSEGPVLAEFIPIKKTTNSCSDDDDDDEDHDDDDDDDDNGGGQQLQKRSKTSNESNIVKDKNNNDLKKKSDWLRSVQLWNQSPDPLPNENVPKKAVVTEVKRNGGAFQPFRREKSVGKSNNNQIIAKVQPLVPASATSSTVETAVGGPGHGGTSRKEEKEGQQPQRKQRRCWSPELHRRFLNALQQLGGSHAATPKQIRELMKVDGLTNDEVKSHLQKYRLHTRRPSPTIHNNSKAQASQFVVVGGLWMPPPEYAAVAATAATAAETATIAATAGIYAPVATQPLTAPQVTMSSVKKLQPAGSENRQSERRGSHSEGGSHSNSPSTCSSTHTTTNSPAL